MSKERSIVLLIEGIPTLFEYILRPLKASDQRNLLTNRNVTITTPSKQPSHKPSTIPSTNPSSTPS